jgi:acetyl esterase/lipase
LQLAVIVAVVSIFLSVGYVSAVEQQEGRLKIFDGKNKVIVVNSYSTSLGWPGILQQKLDRYFEGKPTTKTFDGKHVITVQRAVKAGTPIAKWIDVKTGQPLEPWAEVLRLAIQQAGDTPVIVLAQQSLQGVFGELREGIRDANDRERIAAGADAMEKYVRLLQKEGADLVFLATNIFKLEMEPAIGNERYALDELIKRKVPHVERGPDLWAATKQQFPDAFEPDRIQPNELGAEIIAQKWFERLLQYDGLEAPAWSKEPRQPPQEALPGVKTLRDLEYIPGGHERNKLDLYLPEKVEAGEKAKKLPLIIWVHGGAWLGGDKKGCPAVRFVRNGYAVASVNYRLSQHAIFPAQIEDCKAAVRFLRANADKYGLDEKRFGAWGASAGGHLVALLGTTGDVNDFNKGENLKFSSRVQAVCDYFGPTDFLKIADFPSSMNHTAVDSPESKLIGGAILENKEACRRANPITYVTKNDPPFLLVHGDADPLVPHNQSELLYEALQKAGVEAKIHIVKGGGHGGFKDPAIEKMVEEFFDKRLK